MMYFKVEEDKVETLSENIEKGLRYIGKAMQCVEAMKEQEGMMGQRRWSNQYGSGRIYHRNYPGDPQGNYGMRDMPGPEMGYRGSMGYRHPDYQDPMMY